jgi:hypothetical protein
MIVKADAKVECEIGEDDNPIEKRKLHGHPLCGIEPSTGSRHL